MNHQLVKSDEVVGASVQNNQGEDLGSIEALVLDKQEGKVEYVVLSHGGFLGMGDKLFAMPWDVFSYNAEQDCFKTNVDAAKLENSPGFDKDNWPAWSDPSWRTSIDNYYHL